MPQERRLAAILVADAVGFSRLVGADESGTLAQLAALRRDVTDPLIASHGGRLFKQTGDGFLVEFASAVQAVTCARTIQANAAGGPLSLRIGIHLGDVVVQGDDLMGDGVNIAARLEGIAEPGGITLSRQVHDQVRDRLDVAFEDRGEIDLKNIARPVHVFALTGSKTAPAAALALPDKPSIAVLPFQNMSGDPEQEYFADGVVEDIITALSRSRALFVIARNSSFSYKGKSPDIRQVGRELGVRYVLEGSVRRSGGRMRITGQLIDASTGAHIWADRFEGGVDDIFKLQDEVTSRVVAVIVPALDHAEIDREAARPTTSIDAYGVALRGWAFVNEFSRDGNRKAIEYFHKAAELDPKYALAWAQLAGCYVQRKSWKWTDDPVRDAAEVERFCRRALELDRTDPRVLALTGVSLGYVAGQKEEGYALLKQATELDPNFAFAWFQLGHACNRLGKPSIDCFETSLRLNPRDFRAPFGQTGLALAHIFAGNFAKAGELADQALLQLPTFPGALLARIAAAAHSGDIAKAKSTVATLLVAYPNTTISSSIDTLIPAHYQRILRNGYQLAGIPDGSDAAAPALALPDKPSIAVLPFQNMSGDPEQEYFVDGLVEDIITALSRFKSLFVIARNSSFTYKGRAVDIKQVGRELGVRYVLEGSVRKAGGRVRITGQLIDSHTGAHLWADRFEGALEDVFDLQDRVTESIVGAIAPKIDAVEIERAKRKPVENLDAYDCYLRGIENVYQRRKEACDEALRLACRAIELAPEYSAPYGLAANCYLLRKNSAWVSDEQREADETRRLVMRVQTIGREDGQALAWAGRAMAFVCHEYDVAASMTEQATQANPNLATAWFCRGIVNLYGGNYEQGIEQLLHVVRMSPMDPEYHQFEGFIAYGHAFLGRYGDAIEWSNRARSRRPDVTTALRVAGAANALAGNLEEARRAVKAMLELEPKVTLSYLRKISPYRRIEDRDRFLAGLQLAGLPE